MESSGVNGARNTIFNAVSEYAETGKTDALRSILPEGEKLQVNKVVGFIMAEFTGDFREIKDFFKDKTVEQINQFQKGINRLPLDRIKEAGVKAICSETVAEVNDIVGNIITSKAKSSGAVAARVETRREIPAQKLPGSWPTTKAAKEALIDSIIHDAEQRHNKKLNPKSITALKFQAKSSSSPQDFATKVEIGFKS